MEKETFIPADDKDYICTREIIGHSNFGENSKGEKVVIPIYKITKEHKDTVNLRNIESQQQERKYSEEELIGLMKKYVVSIQSSYNYTAEEFLKTYNTK